MHVGKVGKQPFCNGRQTLAVFGASDIGQNRRNIGIYADVIARKPVQTFENVHDKAVGKITKANQKALAL